MHSAESHSRSPQRTATLQAWTSDTKYTHGNQSTLDSSKPPTLCSPQHTVNWHQTNAYSRLLSSHSI